MLRRCGILAGLTAFLLNLASPSDAGFSLYVSLPNEGQVGRIDAAGNYTAIVTSNLSYAQGIAVDAAGRIYVADSGDDSVKVFSSSGALVRRITGGLSNPHSVLVDSSGNLFVGGQGAVVEFDGAGNPVRTFTASGYSGQTQGLALDRSGNLLVSDYSGSAIREFSTTTGSQIGAIGGISAPSQIALDASGNIFVASANTTRIYEYDPSGTQILNIFSSGLTSPYTYGLAIDQGTGAIFQASFDNGPVYRYDSPASNATVLASLDGPIALAIGPQAGAVPEPASLVLSGLGGIGLMAFQLVRNRRRAR